MGPYVTFTVEDHIGVVTIDHPPVNAVCESIRMDLIEIFESLNTRTDVYAVILQAKGPGFSGGHDLKEVRETKDPGLAARIQPTISRSCTAIYRCRVPVIAAVHGYVIGMGFAYASVCDIIVASEDASFKFPEVNVGTVGGPFWLKRIIPDKLARYHFYTATPLTAKRMEELGAVQCVVPKDQLFDAAMNIAKAIAKKYPPSIWASKMCIIRGELEQYDIVDVSDRMRLYGNNELLGNDPNKRELAMAQLQHREPVFDPEPFKRWETLGTVPNP